MKKGFIIGLATGLTVAGASLVLANSQIQAILNDQIKVTLNGQIQEFKDETTNETQYPITYHDRTYLPLRTVANLVGVDVDYDADSNTAILSNQKGDGLHSICSFYSEPDLGGLMSIVIHEESDFNTHYVYNIKNGSIISNEEFMRLRNISEEDVINRINKYVDDNIKLNSENYRGYSQEEYDHLYKVAKELNNISKIDMFVNEKGTISLVLKHVFNAYSGTVEEIVEL